MQKRLPFPTEILDIPQVTRLKPSPFGIFMRLVMDYWNKGLSVPNSIYDRAAIANSEIHTIQRHNTVVNECLLLVMPFLEAKYIHESNKALKKSYIAKLGGMANADRIKRKAIQAVKDVVKLADENGSGHMEITPVNSPGILQNTGGFDPIARQKAKVSLKAPKATLTDE